MGLRRLRLSSALLFQRSASGVKSPETRSIRALGQYTTKVIDFIAMEVVMTQVEQAVTGQVYSVLLAPITAHVVVRVGDEFLETFVPRSEAEKLRVGREVVASPSEHGTSIRAV